MSAINGVPFFSYDELLILSQKSVEARGADYVYEMPELNGLPGCYYVGNGVASCLVGDMLWTANVIGPDFEEDTWNVEGVESLMAGGLFATDLQGEAYMKMIQRLQDERVPWGETVELASGPHADRLHDAIEDGRSFTSILEEIRE